MSDPLLDLIYDVDHNGIRWVSIIALYALIRKERRNHYLDLRDKALFQNLKSIMEERGIGQCFVENPNLNKNMEEALLKRGLTIISPARFMDVSTRQPATKKLYWRQTKMNSQNINYATLIPTILGAAKLILQTFGIDIPDETINEIVNGAAAVGTIIGIFLAHRKQVLVPTEPVPTDPTKFIQG